MITIVIPLPDCLFFPQACLRNIHETIGVKNFKVIFILNKNNNEIEKELIKTNLDHEILKYEYVPKKGIHLILLDRAFKELPDEWIYVQHADMFWIDYGWGIDLLNFMNNSSKKIGSVLHENCKNEFNCVRYKFSINNKKIIRTHDFAGLYNRSWFIKNNFSFEWGKLKSLSKNLLENIKNIKKIHLNENLKLGDWLDGSDLISIESFCLDENSIGYIKSKCKYFHVWDLFSICHDMSFQKSKIIINRKENKSSRSLHVYSWISSNLFNKNQKILPWKLIKKISKYKNCEIKSYKTKFCNFVEKYKIYESIGEDEDMGIKIIQFKDKKYNLTTKIYY